MSLSVSDSATGVPPPSTLTLNPTPPFPGAIAVAIDAERHYSM